MLTYTGIRRERVMASPQFRNGVFHNAELTTMGGMSWPIARDFFFDGKSRAPKAPLPLERPLLTWTRPALTGLRVTWLGHSTMLIEMDGMRILTDPVFGKRASPVPIGGTRLHPPPVTIDELPPIDVVLLSHDHYDHLCASTMRQIAKRRWPIVTSLGVGARLEKLGVDPSLIVELDWWEALNTLGGSLSFMATPARHFSGRGLNDRNQTLWSSWVIESDSHRVFFSGDTGLHGQFGEIAERCGPFDLTMLEIGASNPAWHAIHLGPANALKAFEQLGGGTLLPIHWSTFDLALHAWDEPAETLVNLAAETGAHVLTPRIGQPIEPLDESGPTPWWRGLRQAQAVSAALRTPELRHPTYDAPAMR